MGFTFPPSEFQHDTILYNIASNQETQFTTQKMQQWTQWLQFSPILLYTALPGSCHPDKALEQLQHQFRDNTLWGWGHIFENTEYALNQKTPPNIWAPCPQKEEYM